MHTWPCPSKITTWRIRSDEISVFFYFPQGIRIANLLVSYFIETSWWWPAQPESSIEQCVIRIPDPEFCGNQSEIFIRGDFGVGFSWSLDSILQFFERNFFRVGTQVPTQCDLFESRISDFIKKSSYFDIKKSVKTFHSAHYIRKMIFYFFYFQILEYSKIAAFWKVRTCWLHL